MGIQAWSCLQAKSDQAKATLHSQMNNGLCLSLILSICLIFQIETCTLLLSSERICLFMFAAYLFLQHSIQLQLLLSKYYFTIMVSHQVN